METLLIDKNYQVVMQFSVVFQALPFTLPLALVIRIAAFLVMLIKKSREAVVDRCKSKEVEDDTKYKQLKADARKPHGALSSHRITAV